MPLQTQAHAVQALNHHFRPRTVPAPIAGIRCIVKVRHEILEVNKRCYRAVKIMYDTEVKDMQEFAEKRAYFEECLATFNKFMVNSRRQRALQLDINQRKIRLEAMRDLRLQSMQEAKLRQIAQDKEKETVQKAKEAAKKSTVTVVAQNAKKAIRAAQDKVTLILFLVYNFY